jgi:hypothetical protein
MSVKSITYSFDKLLHNYLDSSPNNVPNVWPTKSIEASQKDVDSQLIEWMKEKVEILRSFEENKHVLFEALILFLLSTGLL